ncbi:MAG: helix-turn-helix domain-containing protein [Erysipelotrichaceae bacterium]|nr:helix-turn-helix domain-containing protein [Erysipelotrichaceae bacterium]
MKWSEKVKNLLNEKGMNQKDLSKKSGITEASVCRYLKGDRRPRIDVIVNFAEALGVEVDFLLDEEQHIMTPFESIEAAIARHGNELSDEEKERLVKMILKEE